jgi:phosphoribosylglycinamide formyltransferase 1
MRIVILASSGGSAFIETKKILDNYSSTSHEYFVFTDRPCGIEEYCLTNSIACEQIPYTNRKDFSQKVAEKVAKIGHIDVVLLYFLRILTEDFFKKYLTLNIHPALLPAFRGVDAVKQCFESKAKFIGATLHLVDAGVDTGLIIGQIATPISHLDTEHQLNKISFLQKVYLSLLVIDLLSKNSLKFNKDFSSFEFIGNIAYTSSSNPCIQNIDLLKGFDVLQQKEHTQIIKI